MNFVVVVKTASEQPLWAGLPSDYPVACEEFDTLDEATKKWPGKLVMSTQSYREYAAHFHNSFPAPEQISYLVPILKKRWWEYLFFWRNN